MEKVLVSLKVPSVGMSFEVRVPIFLTIREVVPLLTEAITDITNQEYAASGSEQLCWAEKEVVFSQSRSLQDYGVQHGDQLYLF